VPTYPASPVEMLAHTGPMTRTVRDAALLLNVIAGPDERDRLTLPTTGEDWLAACEGGSAGLRVAWSPNLGYAAVDPEVARITAAAARRFAGDLGCIVEEADPGFPDPVGAELILFYVGVQSNVADLPAERYALLDPDFARAIEEEGAGVSALDYVRANGVRQSVAEALRRFFARYDLLLTPTLTTPPFPVHMQGPEKVGGRYVRDTAWLSFAYPFNLTGQPAATVPAGFTEDGLPVGLQIVGRHLDDGVVLRAAAAFEAARPWAGHRPPVEELAAG
jgi:aspartyl-tRNA(Asn)/glutamyl-tRNA(Gln) amidotransferase subunit A